MPADRPVRPAFPSGFVAAQDGAVTVDWAVLCAAVTALTVAMNDDVRASLNFFSDEVSEELTNSEIVRTGQENKVDFAFDDGQAGRWSGAMAADIPGFGYALGPIAGSGGLQSVTHDFIMASDVETSVIRFDLYSLDSLDGEDGVIYVNNVEVGRITTWHGNPVFSSSNVAGITIAAEIVASDEHLGGYGDEGSGDPDWWKDAITTITIAVADPGDVLSFGFGSTANQGTDDESYAIDNFSISGVRLEEGAAGEDGDGGV